MLRINHSGGGGALDFQEIFWRLDTGQNRRTLMTLSSTIGTIYEALKEGEVTCKSVTGRPHFDFCISGSALLDSTREPEIKLRTNQPHQVFEGLTKRVSDSIESLFIKDYSVQGAELQFNRLDRTSYPIAYSYSILKIERQTFPGR